MDIVERSWQYFQILERSFVETTAYVDVDPRNFQVFSDQFRSLLILIGAEIDTTCKFICKQANPASKANNINNYKTEILQINTVFYLTQIHISQYRFMFAPWLSWHYNSSPTWWKAYNNVKHDRHKYRAQANLFNVMQALSGLFSLQFLMYKGGDTNIPSSNLFTWNAITGCASSYIETMISIIERTKTDLISIEISHTGQ